MKLFPESSEQQNKVRARSLMDNKNVQAAIHDKQEIQLQNATVTREKMVARINALIDRVEQLPDSTNSLKLNLACLNEMSKISGLHSVNVNVEQKRNVEIHLIGIDQNGNDIVDAVVVDETPALPPADSNQLTIQFPSADAVKYDLSDLDDISDELPFD